MKPAQVRSCERAAFRHRSALTLAALLLATPLGRAQNAQGNALPNPSSPPPSAPAQSEVKPAAASTNTPNNSTQARPADATKFLRYVRVGANGAKLRNIYDAQGLVVLEGKADEVLAVYSERGEWLEVEAPSGFSVWVFGEYLAPSADAGVL